MGSNLKYDRSNGGNKVFSERVGASRGAKFGANYRRYPGHSDDPLTETFMAASASAKLRVRLHPVTLAKLGK